MAITYPISLPAAFATAQITIRQCGIVGESVSPFSGAQQLYAHPGQWWEAEFSIPPARTRNDAEDIIAAFMSLRNKEGTFLMGDPLNTAPRGAGGGTPVVDGASQSGPTLAIRGGPVSTANWLRAGDWIQLGSGSTTRLHKLMAAATTDGTGKATLDIWPALRASPADGATVTITATKGIWQLASNQLEYTIQAAMTYGLSVAIRERL